MWMLETSRHLSGRTRLFAPSRCVVSEPMSWCSDWLVWFLERGLRRRFGSERANVRSESVEKARLCTLQVKRTEKVQAEIQTCPENCQPPAINIGTWVGSNILNPPSRQQFSTPPLKCPWARCQLPTGLRDADLPLWPRRISVSDVSIRQQKIDTVNTGWFLIHSGEIWRTCVHFFNNTLLPALSIPLYMCGTCMWEGLCLNRHPLVQLGWCISHKGTLRRCMTASFSDSIITNNWFVLSDHTGGGKWSLLFWLKGLHHRGDGSHNNHSNVRITLSGMDRYSLRPLVLLHTWKVPEIVVVRVKTGALKRSSKQLYPPCWRPGKRLKPMHRRRGNDYHLPVQLWSENQLETGLKTECKWHKWHTI